LVEYARSGKGEDGQGRASQAQARSTGVKWGALAEAAGALSWAGLLGGADATKTHWRTRQLQCEAFPLNTAPTGIASFGVGLDTLAGLPNDEP
jgi:hypothetical protein